MSKALQATPQQIRAANPQASAWVGANAGSGKTHVLVDRIIRLMLHGAAPASILCLTYTKAAATEMAERVHQRLSLWVGLDDDALRVQLANLGEPTPAPAVMKRARQLFTAALETPGGFKIQTIHAFCEKILQLFPVEAGLAPGFAVLDAATTEQLLEQARDDILGVLEPADDGDNLFDPILRYAQSDRFDTLLRLVLNQRQALLKLLSHWGSLGAVEQALRTRLAVPAHATLATLLHELAVLDEAKLQGFFPLLAASGKTDQKAGAVLAELIRTQNLSRKLTLLRSLYLTQKGEPRKNPITVGLLKKYPDMAEWLTAEQQRVLTLIRQHDYLVQITATISLLTTGLAITERFNALKQARGAYDFEDLILRTRALLNDRQAAQWVLFKLDRGIEHVLVDEAQDTSEAQWDIVNALTQEFFAGAGRQSEVLRTLFVVGDHKQSIFSFQGANPQAFASSRHKFSQQIQAAGQLFHDVDLTISYRTTPEILHIVDAVFASGAPARKGMAGADSDVLHHESNRKGAQGLFELWPLTTAEAVGEADPWTAPVDKESATSPRRLLARKIARTIKSWLGKRQISALRRPVQPGDILILFRSRNSLFDALISELRKQQVPVAGADRLRLSENIAVMDVMALIHFMLQPRDDYALACLLKSPLVPLPFSEDELIDLAAERRHTDLWQRLLQSQTQTARQAAETLQRWQVTARTCRPFEFLSQVLVERRKAILARLGSEAGDALNALLEMALSFEQSHPASLSGFASWMASEDTEIKRNMEANQGEVRLMTVHGAKGLEASIVIMPDTTGLPNDRETMSLLALEPEQGELPLPLWRLPDMAQSEIIDGAKALLREASLQEHRRLLYVAMTRAKDELYICGSQNLQEVSDNSWYAMVKAALVETPRPQPLLHPALDRDGATVFRLGPDPVYENMQMRDKPPQAVALPEWITRPAPHANSLKIRQAPSALGYRKSYPQSMQALRRGRVLHRLLQELPRLNAAGGEIFARRLLARHALDKQLLNQVQTLLAMPEHQAFFGEHSQSEVSIGALLPNGNVLQGTIDRLVITPQNILLLDYKSDGNVPRQLEADHPYVQQIAAYRFALEQAYPERPVKAAILWTTTLDLQWLEPALLQHATAALLAG